MEKFVIEGGVPLSGTVVPAGNKNAALPLLACALLTDEDVTLHNVPHIRDTEALLELLDDLGVRIDRPSPNTVVMNAANVRKTDVDAALAERIRASFLAAGPLLARFGAATMPPPGGDVIGRRRLDPHLDAFRALGATVEHGHDIVIKAPDGGLRPCDFFMDEPSVMGTENALMAAAATAGTTVIRNAACEPHVQDLARMLNKMGAAIEGIGSNVMQVHGVAKLGGCEHTRQPRPHRDRLVHGAGRRDGRRAADRRLRGRGPADDPDGVPAARAGLLDGGRRRASSPAARRCGWSATPATTSPRSRTARGRRSRPTSRRSPSRSRPSPRARC